MAICSKVLESMRHKNVPVGVGKYASTGALFVDSGNFGSGFSRRFL